MDNVFVGARQFIARLLQPYRRLITQRQSPGVVLLGGAFLLFAQGAEGFL